MNLQVSRKRKRQVDEHTVHFSRKQQRDFWDDPLVAFFQAYQTSHTQLVSQVLCMRRSSLYVVWLIAICGGFLIGFELVVSGNIFQLDDFILKFFPHIFRWKRYIGSDNFCKPPSWTLQELTAISYIVSIISSFFTIPFCRKWGWRTMLRCMYISVCISALVSSVSNGFSVFMIGRMIASICVGFASQVIPRYVIDIAAPKRRGVIEMTFQVSTLVGVAVGNMMNYWASIIRPWGWRILLGFEGIPAFTLIVLSLFVLESPKSLVERNQNEQAKAILLALRGREMGPTEFLKIISDIVVSRHDSIVTLWSEYRPQLLIGVLAQVCSVLNGSMIVSILMPRLFSFLGFSQSNSLLSSLFISCTSAGSIICSYHMVEKVGRRRLILSAYMSAAITLVLIWLILLVGMTDEFHLERIPSAWTIVLMCSFVFFCSAPLNQKGWLIEGFPSTMTWVGSIISADTNWLASFLASQAVVVAPCFIRSWVFFIFAGFCFLSFGLAYFLLPETAGLETSDLTKYVRNYRLWKHVYCFRQKSADEASNASSLEEKGNKEVTPAEVTPSSSDPPSVDYGESRDSVE